mmetsp:Transcript_622/g.873  ORF Transcript_622/g.873 Transcript_622/m.873 type:complete len:98 (-) Transcript_622:211-504(-)
MKKVVLSACPYMRQLVSGLNDRSFFQSFADVTIQSYVCIKGRGFDVAADSKMVAIASISYLAAKHHGNDSKRKRVSTECCCDFRQWAGMAMLGGNET